MQGVKNDAILRKEAAFVCVCELAMENGCVLSLEEHTARSANANRHTHA